MAEMRLKLMIIIKGCKSFSFTVLQRFACGIAHLSYKQHPAHLLPLYFFAGKVEVKENEGFCVGDFQAF